MKKIKKIILIVLVCVLIIFITRAIIKYRQFYQYSASKEDIKSFSAVVETLNNALKQKDINKLYNLFNSAFQKEVSFDKFKQSYLDWLGAREYSSMKIQSLRVLGRIGHVSSKLKFKDSPETFLYQSWIKTSRGWRLVWLNRLLPKEMLHYGESQKYEIQILKQRSLEELFVHDKIRLITRDLQIPKNIFIETKQARSKSFYQLSNFIVNELTKQEIMAQAHKTDAYYYLEFATVRIIDDIASVYIDIHPLYANIPRLNRSRGIQLFFIRNNEGWDFDSPGARW